MQLKIWLDDTNYITIAAQLQAPGSNGYGDSPEIIAATIVDRKLSNIQEDQFFDLTAAILEHFERPQQKGNDGAQADWRTEWLDATRQ